MYKKSLILVSAFLLVLCVFSGFVSATDTVKNAVNGATNTVMDGVNSLGSDVRTGIGNVENGIEGAINDMGNNMENNNNNNDTTNQTQTNNFDTGITGTDYTATRTTADLTGNATNTATTWVWIILAVSAVVIVGLVWYYATQNNND